MLLNLPPWLDFPMLAVILTKGAVVRTMPLFSGSRVFSVPQSLGNSKSLKIKSKAPVSQVHSTHM